MDSLLDLEAIGPGEEGRVGGKAAGLARLLRLGFPVPAGFVLTREAYTASLCFPPGDSPGAPDLAPPGELLAAIRTHAESLLKRGIATGCPSLVVRSSASDEDDVTRSFSGIYDSFLDITELDTLLRKVVECWSGLWSEQATRYRGAPPDGESFMSVIVQIQVDARYAGVAFTRDPRRPDRNELLIEATEGLAEELVSGERDASRFRVTRERGPAHTLLVAADDPAGESPAIPSELIEEVARLAIRAEEALGAPQDMEWVQGSRGLFVVQSRPITAQAPDRPLAARAPEGFEKRLEEPFTRFGAWVELRKALLYERSVRRIKGPGYRREVAFVGGYLHLRQSGSRLGRAWETGADLWYLLRWKACLRRYRTAVERYQASLSGLRRRAENTRDPGALLRLLEEATETYLAFSGREAIPAGHLANLYPLALRRVCRLLDPQDSLRAEALLLGLESDATRRDLGLWRACRIDSAGDREQALEEFQREYGYVWADLNPKDPGWWPDEGRRAALVAAHREMDEGESPEARQVARKRRAADAEDFYREKQRSYRPALLRPLVSLLFSRALHRARTVYPLREDRNHAFYRGVMTLREIQLRLGESLVRSGELEMARHTFALDGEELRSVVDGKRSLAGEASRRSSEVLAAETGPAPGPVSGDPAALGGLAASPGVTEGRARLVLHRGDARELRRGEILVCPSLRPYLTPLLLVSAALVTDRGSVLSHGANLAREYGIPAVVSTGDASRRIRSGDLIRVDGEAGRVTILEPDGGEARSGRPGKGQEASS